MKVYLVIEQWNDDETGEHGTNTKIFKTLEKAKEYLEEYQEITIKAYDYLNKTEKSDNNLKYYNWSEDNSNVYSDIYIEEKEIVE